MRALIVAGMAATWLVAGVLMTHARAEEAGNPTLHQGPPVGAAPAEPCSRGQSTVRLGGVDLDVMRCQLFTLRQEREAADDRANNAETLFMMTKHDLDAMSKAASQAREEADYWRDYAGFKPKEEGKK